MNICICGGGHLGHVSAGYLSTRGKATVDVLTRRPERWGKTLIINTPEGNELNADLHCVTSDPREVVGNADLVLLCLPGMSIAPVLSQIKDHLRPGTPVGSIVSNTGFFFEAKRLLSPAQPLFGFQRVPFIARTTDYGHRARLLGYKPELAVAIEQTDDKNALKETLSQLFNTPVRLLESYFEASLSNSNPLLHPARLYELWSCWTPGIVYPRRALFYEEWGVKAAQTYIEMDGELQCLLRCLGVNEKSVPDVLTYYESTDAPSLAEKLRSIEAFKGIEAPMKATTGGWMPDLDSRYFTEDIPYGLATIRRLAHEHGVACPTIDRIYAWGEGLICHRHHQLRMLDILTEVDKVCRRHDIRYWLSSGTLIGALRHGGFIPWDDDLDIEMMRADYLRLLPLLEQELPDWLALQTHATDPNYCFFYAKIRDKRSFIEEENHYDSAFKERGIYIDIFPLEAQRKWVHLLSEHTFGHAYKWWKRGQLSRVRILYKVNEGLIYPLLRLINRWTHARVITSGLGIPFHNPRYKEEIFPLSEHEFEGRSFPVPGMADSHLRHIYGDYMKLPDPKTVSLHLSTIKFNDKS